MELKLKGSESPEASAIFGLADTLLPTVTVPFKKWVSTKRILPKGNAFPGNFRIGLVKAAEGVYDAMEDDDCRQITLCVSVQLMKTEFMINVALWHLDEGRGTCVLVEPTDDLVQTINKERINPSIRHIPSLREQLGELTSRNTNNKKDYIDTQTAKLALVSAGSKVSLVSRPVPLLLMDEVDRYGMSQTIEQAIQRQITFPKSKIIVASTPYHELTGESPIEEEWKKGSRGRYHGRCPMCAKLSDLDWKHVKWKKDPGSDLDLPIADSVHYECEHCGSHWDDYQRREAVNNGEWVHENLQEKRHLSFHTTILSSPWSKINMPDLAAEFVSAVRKADRGDGNLLSQFVCDKLANKYKPITNSVSKSKLYENREPYLKKPLPWEVGGILPGNCLVVTAGIDLHQHFAKYEIVGWGWDIENSRFTRWGIRTGRIMGSIDNPAMWEDLASVVNARMKHPMRAKLMPPHVVFVDSGWNTTKTREECAKQQRLGFNWSPCKGTPTGDDKTVIDKHTGRRVYRVSVNSLKEIVFSNLVERCNGSGSWHFPLAKEAGYDRGYFDELTAEIKIEKMPRKWIWVVQDGRRNEALDCAVYAFAACRLCFGARAVSDLQKKYNARIKG